MFLPKLFAVDPIIFVVLPKNVKQDRKHKQYKFFVSHVMQLTLWCFFYVLRDRKHDVFAKNVLKNQLFYNSFYIVFVQSRKFAITLGKKPQNVIYIYDSTTIDNLSFISGKSSSV